MKTNKLQDFFEEQGFIVHLDEQDGVQCAEIEKWTDGGVDMIICLQPFNKEEFLQYVEDFDVDENIDLHRQGKDYKKAFTITESVKDFTDFHNHLKEVVEKMKVFIEVKHLLSEPIKSTLFDNEHEFITFTKLIAIENEDDEEFILATKEECIYYIENYCTNLELY